MLVDSGLYPLAEGLSVGQVSVTKLTARQNRFIEEFLIDLNATQAAIRAGYSAKTAEVTASRLLRIVKVQAAIADAKANRSARTEITQDMVVKDLALVAFANIGDYMSWTNSDVVINNSDSLTGDQLKAVAEVTKIAGRDGGSTVKFKLHDKLDALDKLAKHLGMFVQRQEIVGDKDAPLTVSIAQLAREAREDDHFNTSSRL